MLHDKPSAPTGCVSFVFTTIVNGISVSCGMNTTENRACEDSFSIKNQLLKHHLDHCSNEQMLQLCMYYNVIIKLTVIINNGNS